MKISPLFQGATGAHDIISVIDTSTKLPAKVFEQVKMMYQLLINEFNVSPQQTHVALVTFINTPRTVLRLSEGTDKAVINGILSALMQHVGEPNLGKALQNVIRLLDDRSYGSTPSRQVPTKVVVYTSGMTKKTIEAASPSIEAIRRRGADVILIMVSDDKKMKEAALSSLPTGTSVISSASVGALGEPFSQLIDKVTEKKGNARAILIRSHVPMCHVIGPYFTSKVYDRYQDDQF